MVEIEPVCHLQDLRFREFRCVLLAVFQRLLPSFILSVFPPSSFLMHDRTLKSVYVLPPFAFVPSIFPTEFFDTLHVFFRCKDIGFCSGISFCSSSCLIPDQCRTVIIVLCYLFSGPGIFVRVVNAKVFLCQGDPHDRNIHGFFFVSIHFQEQMLFVSHGFDRRYPDIFHILPSADPFQPQVWDFFDSFLFHFCRLLSHIVLCDQFLCGCHSRAHAKFIAPFDSCCLHHILMYRYPVRIGPLQ